VATNTVVTLNPGGGGARVVALLMADGTTMPVSTLMVSSDGVADPTPVTLTHPLPVSSIPPFVTNYSVSISAVSGVVKGTAAQLLTFKATNRNAAARYLQIFQANTLPAPSAVPYDQFLVPAVGILIVGTDFFTTRGLALATGYTFGFSTTPALYTAATAADHDFSTAYS
jgi:hypothetical protein